MRRGPGAPGAAARRPAAARGGGCAPAHVPWSRASSGWPAVSPPASPREPERTGSATGPGPHRPRRRWPCRPRRLCRPLAVVVGAVPGPGSGADRPLLSRVPRWPRRLSQPGGGYLIVVRRPGIGHLREVNRDQIGQRPPRARRMAGFRRNLPRLKAPGRQVVHGPSAKITARAAWQQRCPATRRHAFCSRRLCGTPPVLPATSDISAPHRLGGLRPTALGARQIFRQPRSSSRRGSSDGACLIVHSIPGRAALRDEAAARR